MQGSSPVRRYSRKRSPRSGRRSRGPLSSSVRYSSQPSSPLAGKLKGRLGKRAGGRCPCISATPLTKESRGISCGPRQRESDIPDFGKPEPTTGSGPDAPMRGLPYDTEPLRHAGTPATSGTGGITHERGRDHGYLQSGPAAPGSGRRGPLRRMGRSRPRAGPWSLAGRKRSSP